MTPESLDDLYRDQVILDHCRHPRNSGSVDLPDFSCSAVNPFCGDEVHFQLKVGNNARISEVGFKGEGCAINQASGSLLSEAIHGLTVSEALELSCDFSLMMEKKTCIDLGGGGRNIAEMGELAALYRVREFPIRVKCALLAWTALDNGIRDYLNNK
jgi:nitrogen fixation NifU-like protein